MKEATLQFTYEDATIQFLQTDKAVMVNATEMSKIFGKQVVAFLRNDDTKAFIQEALKSENSHFLGVEKEEDLVLSRQRSGTFMHRILALKFAAWLSPAFELWVYATIDEILFGHFREMEESIKESARRKAEMEKLESELAEDPVYQRLEILRLQEKQAAYRRSKENRNQLSMFKEMLNENE